MTRIVSLQMVTRAGPRPRFRLSEERARPGRAAQSQTDPIGTYGMAHGTGVPVGAVPPGAFPNAMVAPDHVKSR